MQCRIFHSQAVNSTRKPQYLAFKHDWYEMPKVEKVNLKIMLYKLEKKKLSHILYSAYYKGKKTFYKAVRLKIMYYFKLLKTLRGHLHATLVPNFDILNTNIYV